MPCPDMEPPQNPPIGFGRTIAALLLSLIFLVCLGFHRFDLENWGAEAPTLSKAEAG